MFLKSPSEPATLPASTSSSSSSSNFDKAKAAMTPELEKAGPQKGQAEEQKIAVVVPEVHKAADIQGKGGKGNGSAGAAAGVPGGHEEVVLNKNKEESKIAIEDEAAKKAAEEKKKKKKKMTPPTLFEFDGVDTPRKSNSSSNKGANNNDKSPKKPSKPKAPSPPPPSPPKPAVVAAPVKQQHHWNEQHNWSDNNSGTDGGEEDSDVSVGSVIDSSLSDTDDIDNDDHDAVDDVDDNNSPPTAAGRNRLPNLDSEGNPSSSRPKLNTPLWEDRKNKVKQAFLHAWNAYRRDAWGKDEYHPITKYGTNMIQKGQGFTIVDSLDTILLMGLDKEFQEAKAWVRDELNFDQDGDVNLFETTIRVLGGLLSAYDQSGHDPVFLTKAVDLADRLMGGFETPSGIPYASVHLKDRRGVPSHDRGISSTSEVATLQLEFKYLSYLTNDDKYWKAAENVVLKMRQLDSLDGLVPIYINPYTGNFHGGEIRLGSRGDSYYGKQALSFLFDQTVSFGL